jgi:TolA-binding protein
VSRFGDSPLASDSLYALGVTQEELGQTEQAGASYASFIERFPEHALVAEVTMRRGETLFAAKKFQEAEQLFKLAADLKGFALADHALLREAACWFELREYKQAADHYAALAKQFPKSSYLGTAQLWAGKSLFFADQYLAAREQLAAASAWAAANRDKQSSQDLATEAAHWSAQCLLKENQPEVALKVAEAGLAIEPATPYQVHLELDRADALYELPERRAEAAEQYARIAEQHAEHELAPQALYMAAFAALAQSESEVALQRADSLIKLYAQS